MKRLIALPLALIIIVTSIPFFAFADDPGTVMIRLWYNETGNINQGSYITYTANNSVLIRVGHKYWYVDRFILNRGGAIGWTRYSFRIGGLLNVGDTSDTSLPNYGNNLSTQSYNCSISNFNTADCKIYIQNSGTTEIEDEGRTPVYRSASIVIDMNWPDDTSYDSCTITLSTPITFYAIDSANTFHQFVLAIDNVNINHNPDPILLGQYNLLSQLNNYQILIWNYNRPGTNYIDRFHQFLDSSYYDKVSENYSMYWPHSQTGLPFETPNYTWRNFDYLVKKLLSKKLSYDVGQIEAANNQGALDAVSEAQAELPNAFDIIAGQTSGASNATVYSPNVWTAVGDLFGWWSQGNLDALNTIPANRIPEETFPYLQTNIDEMNNILYPDDGGD